MTTLLRGLHSIAAQRGDGLRPELLRVLSLEPESLPSSPTVLADAEGPRKEKSSREDAVSSSVNGSARKTTEGEAP